jgi:hypothetical protein
MSLNFFKNKNFWILSLLFVFFLFPYIVQGSGFMEVCSWQEWLTFPATTFMCVLKWFFTAIIKAFLMLLFLVWTIPLTLMSSLLSIGISILSASIVPLLSVPVLESPIVVEMWKFIRDFSNLFFILFFVFIGLSTILGIDSYKYQKTLPLLIIMALLINFSLLFVGFVVDIGNILTGVFIQSVQGVLGPSYAGISSLHLNVLGQGLIQIWETSWADPVDSLMVASGLVVYVLVLVGVYALMNSVFWIIIFLFVYRIAILWILAILSPLAFISYVFTPTKKIWSRWLSNLIKWSIVAVPILFFMFIGLKTLQLSPTQFQQIASSLPTDGITGRISQLITIVMTPLLSVIIMSIGVVISMTSLPEFAQGAIDASKTGKNWVRDTGIGLVRKTNTGSQLESSIMKGLESNAIGRMFVGPTGTFNQKREKDKASHAALLANIRGDELKSLLKQSDPGQKAVILEKLASEGDLDSKTFKENINSATIGGADRSKILQTVPLMAENNKEFQKILTKLDVKGYHDMSEDTWEDYKSSSPDQHKKQEDIVFRLLTENPGSQKSVSKKMMPERQKKVYDTIERHQTNLTDRLTKQLGSKTEAEKKVKDMLFRFEGGY